jgi:hypothetical protein
MNRPNSSAVVVFASLILAFVLPSSAQQKGQWVPGQVGLNAGILPDPGFTGGNLTLNYSATELKNGGGHSVPIKGTYSFWAIEQIVYYVAPPKILGGHFAALAFLPLANGSLTVPTFGLGAGGQGYADTFVEPVILGWSLKRVDSYAGYGFTAPTGRFFPLASNNVGSGYWGNNFVTGTTFYLTKNKGTSLNLTTDWEIHGTKRETNIIPGQAFTDEWGLGQVLPLKKDLSRLLQLGVIGYDQWQVTANKGITAPVPYYSVHAIGVQSNFIIPTRGISLTFKYEPEYRAIASPQGRTFVFGFVWNVRDPKPVAKP